MSPLRQLLVGFIAGSLIGSLIGYLFTPTFLRAGDWLAGVRTASPYEEVLQRHAAKIEAIEQTLKEKGITVGR